MLWSTDHHPLVLEVVSQLVPHIAEGMATLSFQLMARVNLFLRRDIDSKISYSDGLCANYFNLDTPFLRFEIDYPYENLYDIPLLR